MRPGASDRLSANLSRACPILIPMARRPDPERLYAAHRAGLTMRLVREARISPERTEGWISAWEAEAALRDLDRRTGGWWEPAWGWIAEQRQRSNEQDRERTRVVPETS